MFWIVLIVLCQQIWNIHIGLPSDVKPDGWSDGNCRKKEETM